ncbi:MAG: hypothetical protein WBC83_00145 [Minisyncoccia bacterium]
MKMEQLTPMTPEQIAEDEAEIKKIRERNLAERAALAAQEKIKEADESHDFGDELYSNKALQREKQIETLRKEISEMQ